MNLTPRTRLHGLSPGEQLVVEESGATQLRATQPSSRWIGITAGREHRFTPERCQRIDRAVTEIELRSMTHALPKTSKRGDCRLRLGFIERDNFAAEFLDQAIQSWERLRAQARSYDDTSFEQRNRTQLASCRVIQSGS